MALAKSDKQEIGELIRKNNDELIDRLADYMEKRYVTKEEFESLREEIRLLPTKEEFFSRMDQIYS